MRLSGNFRSHPSVVAAVNAIGQRLIGVDYAPLTVGRIPAPASDEPELGPRVELLLTPAAGWAEDEVELSSASESGPATVAEARALAARLAELVRGGVKRSEIVVLLRAYTHAPAFEEALRLAGLEPQVIGGRGYWSHQQVEDLICLLSVIANPLDDEPLLGALASPACGLSADALWLLGRAAGPRRHLWPLLGPEPLEPPTPPEQPAQASSEQPAQASLFDLDKDEDAERAAHYLALLPDSDRRRLERFHLRVQSLRRRAPLLTLESLCDRASREFGYDLATLTREGGPARIANVRKLMRLAAEFERREGRDLRGFLDYAAWG
jgi:ATP-dependent exoDNAse (exonuclease V) beta subunit